MNLRLEITKKEKHFIYALLLAVLYRISIVCAAMLAGWGLMALGVIDGIWGSYLAGCLFVALFNLGRDYQKNCL